MKHTKEPWRLGRFTGPASYEEVRETVGNMDVVVDTDNGPYVLAACNINFPDDARANARRIVACVNACDGIQNEVLELDQPHFLSILKQRADLVEAIRLTLAENGHLADGEVCTLKRLKDALAKVGVGTTATEEHND